MDYIQSGDAEFVEVIHTTKALGTIYDHGDLDVYVDVTDWGLIDAPKQHAFAVHLHMAAITGEAIIIASRKDGDGGKILPGELKDGYHKPKKLTNDECWLDVITRCGKVPEYGLKTALVSVINPLLPDPTGLGTPNQKPTKSKIEAAFKLKCTSSEITWL